MKIFSLLIFTLSAWNSLGSSLCVAPSSSGSANGSDWNNAMTLPSGLIRGNTYYFAQGSYGAHTFQDAESGTTVITLLHATDIDHGPDTGWVNGMGATNSVFSGPQFLRSYYTVDGVTGSGRGAYGFRFVGQTVIGETTRVGLTGHLIFKHIDSHYHPATDTVVQKGSGDADGWLAATYAILYKMTFGGTNFLFQSNYLHHIFGCPWQTRGVDSLIIDHCIAEKNKNTPSLHSALIADDASDNVTISNSEFADIEGTAFLDLISNSAQTAFNWTVYNNVFYHSGSWNAAVSDICSVNWDGSNLSTANNWKIIGNTIANIKGRASFSFPSPSNSGIIVRNNLFWGNRTTDAFVNYLFIAGAAGYSYDYNYYTAAACPFSFSTSTHEPVHFDGANCPLWTIPASPPFVDWTTANFKLASSFTSWPGITNMGSPFDYDKDGKYRVFYDRGAYEFLTNAAPTGDITNQYRARRTTVNDLTRRR